ncbi:UNVERIFIED_CONTAM: hypothetical protein H355_002592 [Colinus virginianus]|nr:hypothetical protein H355_002592 [Colinus virginianus]
MNSSSEDGQQQQQHVAEQQGSGIAAGAAGGTTPGKKYVFKGSELPEMMRMLRSDNPEEVFKATELFRRALSIESKPPIQEVIDAVCRRSVESTPPIREAVDAAKKVLLNGALEPAETSSSRSSGEGGQIYSPLCLEIHIYEIWAATTVVTDACWALSYLSDGPNERIDAILEAAVSRRLVELLGHSSPLVQTPALRTVGNIVTGNRDQIQCVLNEGLVPRLIELLKWGDFDVRREAAWAVSNAASGGNDQQVEFLVISGCIGPLCELLKTADVKIVSVALEALENVLRVGKVQMEAKKLPENPYCRLIEEVNGLTVLEKLQDAANQEIYDKVRPLLLPVTLSREHCLLHRLLVSFPPSPGGVLLRSAAAADLPLLR